MNIKKRLLYIVAIAMTIYIVIAIHWAYSLVNSPEERKAISLQLKKLDDDENNKILIEHTRDSLAQLDDYKKEIQTNWVKHLNEQAWNELAYTQDYLVKPNLNYPLTAKFSNLDAGIEDTDKGIISCSGKYQASNAFGVPSGGSFFAIFKIDMAGRDSLIAFKMR